jgi:chemosensory pili system protein ChpA (sensor histidine kinase/response regulator)
MEKIKSIAIIVEDDTPLLDAITKRVKSNDIETISCTTGEQAVDYIENIDELPETIYLWLDYYLTGEMNGFDVIKVVKNNPKLKNVRVFMISNSASDENIHNAIEIGVEKYLVKAEHRLDDLIEQFLVMVKENK